MTEDEKHSNSDTLRRVSRLESDLSNLTDKVINLSDIVVSTNTNVDNLVAQVSSLVGSTKPKPPNYQLGVAILSLLIVIMTLAFTPLYKEMQRQHEFDKYIMKHLEEDAREMGKFESDLEWLKHMEERINNRIHSKYGG